MTYVKPGRKNVYDEASNTIESLLLIVDINGI